LGWWNAASWDEAAGRKRKVECRVSAIPDNRTVVSVTKEQGCPELPKIS